MAPTPLDRDAELDALLGQRPSDWWNAFYQDRAKPCPFFGTQPDESLVAWVQDGRIRPGRALDLGCGNARELGLEPGACDLVYDSGCFHHLAPHRRAAHVQLVSKALRPGGTFGLTCFRPEGGSGYSDDEVYERRSLGGGLGYDEPRLRDIWSAGLDVRIVRPMRACQPDSGLFGESFLWAMLAQKPGHSQPVDQP